MRTNVLLMLAFLLILVGFFSTQTMLTGQASRDQFYTSLSAQELEKYGSYTLDDCRNVARVAGYDAQSQRLRRQTVTDIAPVITSTQDYQHNFYEAYDLTGDGKIDYRDIGLCYDSVRETGDFVRSPIARLRSATAPSECSPEGKEICRHGKLQRCSYGPGPDGGILTYAEVSAAEQPDLGQKCIGVKGIVRRVVSKGFYQSALPP